MRVLGPKVWYRSLDIRYLYYLLRDEIICDIPRNPSLIIQAPHIRGLGSKYGSMGV